MILILFRLLFCATACTETSVVVYTCVFQALPRHFFAWKVSRLHTGVRTAVFDIREGGLALRFQQQCRHRRQPQRAKRCLLWVGTHTPAKEGSSQRRCTSKIFPSGFRRRKTQERGTRLNPRRHSVAQSRAHDTTMVHAGVQNGQPDYARF